MRYEGIDISKHNRVQNFVRLSAAVDFVIIRAGGNYDGYYKDSRFEEYYKGAKTYGIPVGAYYDAGKEFIGEQKGRDYANHFLKLIAGKKFEYPIFLDIEVTPRKYRKEITAAAVAFCDTLEDAGYFCGIYASDVSGFKELLIIEQVAKYSKWVARYGAQPSYTRKYGIWQYTSKGTVPGIIGNVDRDVSFINYPEIIKGGHFNGY